MVISLSLIDTGFKRFIQLDNGDHKDNTLDVLRLSVMDNFESCHLNGMKIINYLHEGETLGRKNKLINDWHSKVDLQLDEIQCQKRIVDVLYKMNKYYLN